LFAGTFNGADQVQEEHFGAVQVTNNTIMKESFVMTLQNYFENKFTLIMASTVGI
jgi:hypothetical protein